MICYTEEHLYAWCTLAAIHTIHSYIHTHLWGNVVWSATEGFGCGPIKHVLFAHAKISYLNVAFSIQHHIIQLQISTQTQGTKVHIYIYTYILAIICYYNNLITLF